MAMETALELCRRCEISGLVTILRVQGSLLDFLGTVASSGAALYCRQSLGWAYFVAAAQEVAIPVTNSGEPLCKP